MKKKIILLSMAIISSYSFAEEYVVIVDGDSKYISGNVENKPIEPEKPKEISGLIVYMLASGYEHLRAEADINNTSSSTWNSYYGETKDVAITSVFPEGYTANPKGEINWFNPAQQIYIRSQSGCTDSDYANAHVQYLNKDNEVVFWTNTYKYGSYGTQMRYGKLEDMSDAINPGVIDPYPVKRGILSFDVENNKVKFEKDPDYSGTTTLGWELNNVDISSIKKIKLNSSVLRTDASNGCSATYHMWVLKEGEKYQDIIN
jgi:hypothetical protein